MRLLMLVAAAVCGVLAVIGWLAIESLEPWDYPGDVPQRWLLITLPAIAAAMVLLAASLPSDRPAESISLIFLALVPVLLHLTMWLLGLDRTPEGASLIPYELRGLDFWAKTLVIPMMGAAVSVTFWQDRRRVEQRLADSPVRGGA